MKLSCTSFSDVTKKHNKIKNKAKRRYYKIKIIWTVIYFRKENYFLKDNNSENVYIVKTDKIKPKKKKVKVSWEPLTGCPDITSLSSSFKFFKETEIVLAQNNLV